MRREHVLLIWVGGFLLAVALYLIGPDQFFDACWALIDQIDTTFRNLVAVLGAKTYGVIRAFAIAMYVVFAVLAVIAAQRGQGGFWILLVVSVLFMTLIWRPFGIYPPPLSRWLAALILAVAAALIMTRRAIAMPPRRDAPVPPYPPGRAL